MLQDQGDEEEYFVKREDELGMAVETHVIGGLSKARSAMCSAQEYVRNT